MSSPTHDSFDHVFHETAQRHERVWLFLSMSLMSLLFVVALYLVVHAYGVVVQTKAVYSDPAAVPNLAEFQGSQVKQTGPHSYDVYMLGRIWSWTPSPLKLPEGSTVNFYVTSADVLHGFEVQGTTINVTAIPGIVGKVTYTFAKPGVYHIICNEYCGIGHQAMLGEIDITGAKS